MSLVEFSAKKKVIGFGANKPTTTQHKLIKEKEEKEQGWLSLRWGNNSFPLELINGIQFD